MSTSSSSSPTGRAAAVLACSRSSGQVRDALMEGGRMDVTRGGNWTALLLADIARFLFRGDPSVTDTVETMDILLSDVLEALF